MIDPSYGPKTLPPRPVNRQLAPIIQHSSPQQHILLLPNNNFPPDGGGLGTRLVLPSNGYLAYLRPEKPNPIAKNPNLTNIKSIGLKIKDPPSPTEFGPFKAPTMKEKSPPSTNETLQTTPKPEDTSNVEFLDRIKVVRETSELQLFIRILEIM